MDRNRYGFSRSKAYAVIDEALVRTVQKLRANLDNGASSLLHNGTGDMT
jgi:hypothetical protein